MYPSQNVFVSLSSFTLRHFSGASTSFLGFSAKGLDFSVNVFYRASFAIICSDSVFCRNSTSYISRNDGYISISMETLVGWATIFIFNLFSRVLDFVISGSGRHHTSTIGKDSVSSLISVFNWSKTEQITLIF